MFMMSGGTNQQEKLNQLNGEIRKTLLLIDHLVYSKKRDLDRVEQRYNNDIDRHQNSIKRLTREIEQLETEISRNQK